MILVCRCCCNSEGAAALKEPIAMILRRLLPHMPWDNVSAHCDACALGGLLTHHLTSPGSPAGSQLRRCWAKQL